MTNKNKLFLTSIGLVVLSGIAATSSTFAWFTTTRTASIAFSSATVESKQSNMIIKFDAGNVTEHGSSTDNNLVLTGGNKVTDISGDGINFFKPVWSATEGLATEINAITYGGPASANGYWVEFKVTVEIAGGTNMNVYLGSGTKITAKANADVDIKATNDKAVLGSRMAVIVGTDTAAKIIYAPDAPATGHEYLNAASSTSKVVYNGAVTASKATITNVAASFTTLNANDLANKGYLTTINFGDTSSLTFRVWLEGEDPDTVNLAGSGNSAIGGIFDIAVDLYALEA